MEFDSVHWGRVQISYRIIRADRKTLSITVHPDLSVEVRAPFGVTIDEIRNRVIKRGSWIRNAWREFELYLPKQPARRYVNGETHRYLGRQYRLKAEQGEQNSVKCRRGYLNVTTEVIPTSELIQKLLIEWYRNHALRIFNERMLVCSKTASVEGISQPPITIRRMKNRWGSCSPNGRVTLNLELIKAPKDCIDYVIMHELCHLKIPSHGPKYWRLLERLMPDYKERRSKLNLYADV